MAIGKVSFYDDARAFGFIVPDDGGADVFVHAKYLVNADLLKKDQRVSFELRADKVRVL